MTISRNISVMAQGASSSGILAGGYGGLGASVSPTTAGNVLFTADGSVWSSAQKIVRGTSVATTSGTSIDFTSIPSWVKRITVMFNGVSTNGTSFLIVQIGSTTFTTSGYSSRAGLINQVPSAGSYTATNGFITGTYGANTESVSGYAVFVNVTGNTWLYSGTSFNNGGGSGGATLYFSGSSLTLSGVLDRVRITTINGTDTFDAGSVNILYE